MIIEKFLFGKRWIGARRNFSLGFNFERKNGAKGFYGINFDHFDNTLSIVLPLKIIWIIQQKYPNNSDQKTGFHKRAQK